MRWDDIDRILSEQEEILPSSGFVNSVMDAVRQEAATPPPIPFPWKRALPGLIVAGLTIVLALVAGLVPLFREVRALPPSPTLVLEFASALEAAKSVGAGWIFLALFLALASLKFSMRLAGAKS
ncbi:MAG TPA: hypothetical protein VMW38_02495 [Terriglobia bacterium]|nr:hypothetical protein [Terriglobia bacterium]